MFNTSILFKMFMNMHIFCNLCINIVNFHKNKCICMLNGKFNTQLVFHSYIFTLYIIYQQY